MNGPILLKQLCTVGAILLCLGVSGCRDDVKNIYKGDEGKEEPEKVPNDFDYQTGKEVQINFSYDEINGYRVPFEMYTEIPVYLDDSKDYVKNENVKSFLYGVTDENGQVNTSVELAAYVKDVYLYSEGIGVPRLMHASLNGNVVTSFEEIAVPSLAEKRSVGVRSGDYIRWDKFKSIKLSQPSLNSISTNITDEEKSAIENTAITGGGKFDNGSSYLRAHITLQQNSEVKIYFVSHGANERNNALAYYLYESPEETPYTANEKLQLAFPATKGISEGTGYELLYPGAKENPTVFPKGTSISFALLVDAGNQDPRQVKTNDLNILYSDYGKDAALSFNHYNFRKINLANRAHMVSFLLNKNDGKARIALCFEDQPYDRNNSTNKGDFRDDIFIIELNPKTAAPEDLPEPSKPDLPNYSIISRIEGILCFEDCWPEMGDYDLNDAVLAYEREFYRQNEIYIVAMDETFTFLNNGATYSNGFGYQLGTLKRNQMATVTVDSNYKCEGQGLDEELGNTVIMLFDNAKNVSRGTTFKVRTILKDPVMQSALLLNPFIVVKGGDYGTEGNYMSSNRTEVHLPTPKGAHALKRYTPTSKANGGLWGKEDDASEPSNNIYYVRSGSYPFAIDLVGAKAEDFTIPGERKRIDESYPKFNSWVESNGSKDTDWYIK